LGAAVVQGQNVRFTCIYQEKIRIRILEISEIMENLPQQN
jgi:hypothetical protein